MGDTTITINVKVIKTALWLIALVIIGLWLANTRTIFGWFGGIYLIGYAAGYALHHDWKA